MRSYFYRLKPVKKIEYAFAFFLANQCKQGIVDIAEVIKEEKIE
ncbi:hypothetical protein CHCC20335_2747 [Bacillus paralicheniformis]|nr:hypothetical protein CHCC20335_2747 [Bacillus paralicheniformis]